MEDPVKAALELAIDTKRTELAQLEAALKRHVAESANGNVRKRRYRKKSGFQKGSVPSLVHDILKAAPAPLSASDIAAELTKRGRKTESRFVAAGIARYMGTIFDRTTEGAYYLLKK